MPLIIISRYQSRGSCNCTYNFYQLPETRKYERRFKDDQFYSITGDTVNDTVNDTVKATYSSRQKLIYVPAANRYNTVKFSIQPDNVRLQHLSNIIPFRSKPTTSSNPPPPYPN